MNEYTVINSNKNRSISERVSSLDPDTGVDESERLEWALQQLKKDVSDRIAAASASSIFLARGNFREASHLLSRFSYSEDPCDKLYLCKFISEYRKRSTITEAISLFRHAVVERENLESVRCYLTMCFYAVKKGIEIDTSKVFLNRFHGEIDLDMAIMSYLIATGRSEPAILIGEDLKKSSSETPEVWGWYARSLARRSRWSELRVVIDQGLTIHPNSVPLRRHLIHALENMPGSEDKRTQIAWKIIKSVPDDLFSGGFCFADLVCRGRLLSARLFVVARYQIMRRGALTEKLSSRIVSCAFENLRSTTQSR